MTHENKVERISDGGARCYQWKREARISQVTEQEVKGRSVSHSAMFVAPRETFPDTSLTHFQIWCA
jgi:hypothetical protein